MPMPTSETKDQSGENFAEMFEASLQSSHAEVNAGDKIRATIISVSGENVFFDTGTKIDGVAAKAEFLDKEGQFPFAEGDVLDLFVISVNSSEIRLSRALSGAGGAEMLREAFDHGLPVEGKVKETCKGGFTVTVMNRRAFCPVSQIDARYVANPEEYVGGTFSFAITRFEEKGRNIVLSRRKLLEEEARQAAERFRQEVKPGEFLEGKVSRLMQFGAFVELVPGVEGLVHVSEIGWSRVAQPGDVLQVGETVRVKIIDIVPDPKQGLRISLSIKQVAEDPWNSAGERFAPGQTVDGVVTRLAKFGAFVELAPGIEGLVHISELSYTTRVHKPEDVLSPGEKITIKIKELDLEKRKISLSLRDAEGDPWAEVPTKFKVGQTVSGILEKHEDFGCFVQLQPGVTGLLPKSKLKQSPNAQKIEALRPGETLAVVIEEILPDKRKITLGPADTRDEENWRRFVPNENENNGSLGASLQEAFNRNKKNR